MIVIAVIPARYEASRFPGKLMSKLGNKTVIAHTWEATVNTKLFNEVIVATDNDKIAKEIESRGGNVVMTSDKHKTGSDRIAEAVEGKAVDVIINVQGDEPFTLKEPLEKLIQIFKDDKEGKVDVATLMQCLKKDEDIQNPNQVKVVVNKKMEALYFSRSPIPYLRDTTQQVTYYKHIGIYGYRKKALMDFPHLESTPYEQAEKLEQLRYLENGYTIKMALTKHNTIGIDTQDDLAKAKAYLKTLEK